MSSESLGMGRLGGREPAHVTATPDCRVKEETLGVRHRNAQSGAA